MHADARVLLIMVASPNLKAVKRIRCHGNGLQAPDKNDSGHISRENTDTQYIFMNIFLKELFKESECY